MRNAVQSIMTKLKIRTYPDSVLKAVAKPYDGITGEDKKFALEMIKTMFQGDGVGLAAPQVGVSKRLIVCAPDPKSKESYVFFNPVIKNRKGEVLGPEGCLSLPGISGEVVRAEEIEFEALDIEGKEVKAAIKSFFARVIQHEMDHLDGLLFVDRVDFNKRKELLEAYHETKIL